MLRFGTRRRPPNASACPGTPAGAASPPARPRLEVLEDRTVPALAGVHFNPGTGVLRVDLRALPSPEVVVDDSAGLVTVNGDAAATGRPVPASAVRKILVQGTKAADRVHLAGVDRVAFRGLDGRVHVYGHAGADHVIGSEFNDRLEGGPGPDVLEGHLGGDTLLGGNGHDRLYGYLRYGADARDGGDQLYGGDGNDYLDGHAGRDAYYGGRGSDTLFGREAGELARAVERLAKRRS